MPPTPAVPRPPARPLRVCVDARLEHGKSGGVEQLVLGLAAGLSSLRDGDEEYLFLTREGDGGWLAPALGGRCRPLVVPRTGPSLKARAASAAPALARAYVAARDALIAPAPPPSDGTVEGAGVELMHFTFQLGFRTRLPSIYHPHDLQHVHLPAFFSRQERRWREAVYGALCRQAVMVAVASSWVKRDVVRHFALPDERVQVVPLAPILDTYPAPATAEELAAIRRRFGLPDRFALYPAQTWPHKNHLALLEALRGLRDASGLAVPLVCTGRQTEHAETIRRRAAHLGLASSVHLLGFVTPAELRALYALASAVVVPSLFEAASFPLWEAFRSGVPAACSNVTSLPEQAGDAALVFDPHSPHAIADALRALWCDEALRRALVARGRARVESFTWARTARLFRAHYRRLTARPLTSEDEALLAGQPVL